MNWRGLESDLWVTKEKLILIVGFVCFFKTKKYDVDFIELFIESDLMMLSRNNLFVHGFHDEWFL